MERSPTMRLSTAQQSKRREGERLTALQMLFSDNEEQYVDSVPIAEEASGITLEEHEPTLDLLTSSGESLSRFEERVCGTFDALMSIEPLDHSPLFDDSLSSSESISTDDSDSLYLSDQPGPSARASGSIREFPVVAAEPYSHFIYFAVLKLSEGSLQLHVQRTLLAYLGWRVRGDLSSTNHFLNENQQVDPENRIVSDTRKYFEESWLDAHSTKGEYHIGEYQLTVCELCCETRMLNLRSCCQFPACVECLAQHASGTVMEGYQTVSCPNYACRSNFTYDEIIYRLTYSQFSNARTVYLVRCANIKKKSNEYLCPNCGHILSRVVPTKSSKEKGEIALDSGEQFSITTSARTGAKLKVNKYEKQCDKCLFMTCSHCKSPAHTGISCKKYMQGDKMMKEWSENMGTDNRRRAVKCPKCKSWVQKTTGCDHMSCIVCRTEFCYLCGDRYIRIKFIGSHSEKLSILGCRNNFCESKPVLRRTIRGSIFMAGVVATPVVVAVGVPVVVVGGSAVLATMGAIKLVRWMRGKRSR